MGKLIVFEGLDGSGKSTQLEQFTKYLNEQNIKFRRIKLPDYDNPSSTLVQMYLNRPMSTHLPHLHFMQWIDLRVLNQIGAMIIKTAV